MPSLPPVELAADHFALIESEAAATADATQEWLEARTGADRRPVEA